jgi:hypothetical protein
LTGQLVGKAAVRTAVANGSRKRAIRTQSNFSVLHQPAFIGALHDVLGPSPGNFPTRITLIFKSDAGVDIFRTTSHH